MKIKGLEELDFLGFCGCRSCSGQALYEDKEGKLYHAYPIDGQIEYGGPFYPFEDELLSRILRVEDMQDIGKKMNVLSLDRIKLK